MLKITFFGTTTLLFDDGRDQIFFFNPVGIFQDLKQLEMDIFLLVVHVPFPLFFPKENTQVNRFALVKL